MRSILDKKIAQIICSYTPKYADELTSKTFFGNKTKRWPTLSIVWQLLNSFIVFFSHIYNMFYCCKHVRVWKPLVQ